MRRVFYAAANPTPRFSVLIRRGANINRSMDICEKYGTCKSGLGEEEAARRLELYGRNELTRAKPKPLALRFAAQLKDPMLLVLLGAALVSLVLAFFDFSPAALLEPFLIFFIVFANALISALQ